MPPIFQQISFAFNSLLAIDPLIVAGIYESTILLDIEVYMAELIHIFLMYCLRIYVLEEIRIEQLGQVSGAYDIVACAAEYPEAQAVDIIVLYGIDI